jgi:hypothetical protein
MSVDAAAGPLCSRRTLAVVPQDGRSFFALDDLPDGDVDVLVVVAGARLGGLTPAPVEQDVGGLNALRTMAARERTASPV